MSPAVCPYCRTPVGVEADLAELLCPGCNTPHHVECFEENGGCTVFGCSSAPAEEPKITLAATDVNAPLAGGSAVVSPASMSPPPPPNPHLDQAQAVRFSPSNTLFVGPERAEPQAPMAGAMRQTYEFTPNPNARNRTTFILLGILLGYFGAHSFYAGFRGRGFLQLSLTIFTLGVAGIAVWVWAIIDICTISRDSMDVNFRN